MDLQRVEFRLAEHQTQKLTSWVKEPTILDLKQDFEMAKPSHDSQLLRIQHWNDIMAVKGKAAPTKVKGRSSVQPKLVRRQAEWRYSALTEPFLGSNKLFKVSPTTFEDGDSARQNELVLNWQFRTKLNRVNFIDNYIRATVDEGTSIVKLGWKRVTVMVTQDAPVYEYLTITTDEEFQTIQAALQMKEENFRIYDEKTDPAVKAAVDYYEETQQPVTARQIGVQKVQVEKVLENKPTVEMVNPQNFYIDPSCNGDAEKALFAIVSFETNKAELLKDGRYKNLERVNWETSTPLSEPDHATGTPQESQFRDILRKKVVAYEYWGFCDIAGNGELVPIVCTWIGDTIIRLEENPFPDKKIPFVIVPYLPIKRELFGEPDAELLEDNQKVLGAVMRGMIDLLGQSANAQKGFAKGLLDPLNRRRYENGQDYEFNPNNNPANGIIEHKFPELPQSAMLMLGLQNQEAEGLTGVKAFSGGVSGEAYGDVAAGIKGVLDAAAKREMAILRRLAKGMMEIGTKIIAMNGVFLSKEETVRVTNREFITIKRDDLIGEYDLEVDISTAEVDNAKSQDLAFMLQTIGPKGDPAMVMMILAEIAELKRMPELAEKLRTWKPQVSPEQQEMQKLEIEKLRLEVEKLRSEVDLNNAKAEEARANKDQKNLDQVEQATGIKHSRNIAETQAQARGNQNLQVTKALTTARKEGEKEPDIDAAVGFNELSEQLGQM